MPIKLIKLKNWKLKLKEREIGGREIAISKFRSKTDTWCNFKEFRIHFCETELVLELVSSEDLRPSLSRAGVQLTLLFVCTWLSSFSFKSLLSSFHSATYEAVHLWETSTSSTLLWLWFERMDSHNAAIGWITIGKQLCWLVSVFVCECVSVVMGRDGGRVTDRNDNWWLYRIIYFLVLLSCCSVCSCMYFHHSVPSNLSSGCFCVLSLT